MITTDLANYDGNFTYGYGIQGIYRVETTVVSSFGVANNFGLYDMHGNVWEWCQDNWHSHYEGALTDGSVWFTLRGGSWYSFPGHCRSAYRYSTFLDNGNEGIGFRVVCSGAARTK
jgi:formylglycine-generating enzyme required for sulfatase activity